MGFDFESHLGAVERSVSSLERDGTTRRAPSLLLEATRRQLKTCGTP